MESESHESNAKRQKTHHHQGSSAAPPGRLTTPTVQEIITDYLTKVSLQYWNGTNLLPYDPKVIEDVYYKELGEPRRMNRIMLLELSFYLENYLWPNFEGGSASHAHLMSIVMMVNEKFREKVPAWDCFKKSGHFGVFFKRILGLGDMKLSIRERTDFVVFLINCFQSLEDEMVSKECLRLVSLKIWYSLSAERREKEFSRNKKLRSRWNRIQQKDSKNTKSTDHEKTFIYKLIQDYFTILDSTDPSSVDTQAVRFCERFLELMIDIISQLSTRRYTRILLEDVHFIIHSKRKPLHSLPEGGLFKKLLNILKFYEGFEINDFTGEALTDEEMQKQHYYKMKALQLTTYKHFEKELRSFALSNIGSIDTRSALEKHLQILSNEQLSSLCKKLGLLPSDAFKAPTDSDRPLLTEIIVIAHERQQSQIEQLNRDPLYPNESLLWDPNLVPDDHYAGETCLALPKLNVQFLTFHDYFLRNYTLYRLESTYEIRYDIEDAVKRMQARLTPRGDVEFTGWARMAVPIVEFKITKVANPEIGSPVPAEVAAEVSYVIPQPGTRTDEQIKKEWDSLKQYDVMFLVTISPPAPLPYKPPNENEEIFNAPEGSSQMDIPDDVTEEGNTAAPVQDSFLKKFGLISVRGCEVYQVLDEENNVISDANPEKKPPKVVGRKRKIRLLLDPAQYQLDKDNNVHEKVYNGFNLLIRRRAKENNFKAVLETIRDIMNTPLKVPEWLHDVFLGYGDPNACCNTSTPIRSIDFNDTFISKEHLESCFPNRKFQYPTTDAQLQPPFLITFPENPSSEEPLIVQPKVLPNPGPYPQNQPKKNSVPFTPVQVDAIKRAMHTGLTLVVGPPGTGKTDIAVQIVSNWYHNFPNQRTLIVTHSNQALNQIFEKITYLNIDERHLLRLGHGQEQLETERDFSKFGRVNYMLQLRLDLLSQVEKLAESIGISGDVAYTCETARNFWVYHIVSRIEEFEVRCERNLERVKKGEPIEEIQEPKQVPVPPQKEKEKEGKKDKDKEEEEEDEDDEEDEKGMDVEEEEPKEEKKVPQTKEEMEVYLVEKYFPFKEFFSDVPELFTQAKSYAVAMECARGCFRYIQSIFDQLDDCRAFELLKSSYDRGNFLLMKQAKIIAMTCTHAALKRRELIHLGFKFDNILMEESAQILEIETFIPLLLQQQDPEGEPRLKRIVLIGDHNQLPPVVKNMAIQKYSNLDQSLFARLVRLGVPTLELDSQGRARPSIAALYNWRYKKLGDLPHVKTAPEFHFANSGFVHDYQIINVEDYNGRGESTPSPYFYQNLGEAEYVVAVYMFMRMIGYPAAKITILTSYNGQKHLLRDVIRRRCSNNPRFGWPAKVTTVDRYQGQQNDYVLLSLVRTRTVGHIRDIRRLVVAMSRARLGLYVFCRKRLFSNCYELTHTFSKFLMRPDKLMLVQNEFFPTTRKIEEGVDKGSVFEVQDVVHMGQLVSLR